MKKSKKNKKRLVLFSVLAVFVLVLGIWIGTLINENVKLNKQLGEKQDALVGIQEQNTALDALVDEENETALMEEYARKAGYVYADERVYIQGS